MPGPEGMSRGGAGSFRGPQLPAVGKFSNVAAHAQLAKAVCHHIVTVRYD